MISKDCFQYVENYLVDHSCDGSIVTIDTYEVIYWEQYMTQVTIDPHVDWSKPLKTNFEALLFLSLNIWFC